MSRENVISVSDFKDHPGSDELYTVAGDQFRVMGLSDIWGLIGNLLKFNMIENARTLFDMLVGNPGKYTVEQLIAAIKKAISDLSGKTDQGGPPKLSAGFRLEASGTTADEIRKELEKRGIKNVKALPIVLIFGIASMLFRYGPDIWDKIMEMLKKKEPQKGLKETAASIAMAILLLFAGSAQAQYATTALPVSVSYLAEPAEYLPEPSEETPAVFSEKLGNAQALDEVNAARAKKGLPALIHDRLLSQAAYKAAQIRASRGLHGHLPEGDMTCLPDGAQADAAGCAALDSSWGWQSCCWDDPQYTHAGAAWVMGSDGRRYMHIFVRTEGATTTKESVPRVASYSTYETCTTGSCQTYSSGRSLFRGRRSR